VSASEGDDDAGDGSQGAPWASIRRAIGQAEAGDRILVRGGVYAEGPEGEYIALELGERSSGVSISAYEGEEVKVVPSREGINYGLSLWGDDVEVEGLDFEGFPYAGVIVGQAGRTPRGVVLADAVLRFAPGRHREGVAIVPDNGGAPVVQGVLLSGIRVEGASIGIQCNTGPCNDLRMEGISVLGTGEEGTSSLDGIAVESGDNVVLLDVEVTQAGSDGIDLKATRVGVYGARVTRVARNGIKLWRGGDLVNAVVSHTGADTALGFSEGGRYRILHTVVAYHHFQGPSAYSLTVGYGIGGEYDIEIQNCIFFRNSGGLYMPPNARLKVANNLFAEIDNRTALTFTRDGGELMMGLDALSDEATREALGGSNLVGLDPVVGDAEGDDFRPSAGSPLLGVAAQIEPSVEMDIDFAPRPQGGQPDIGPYEAP
jgi:hypothetical protein